MDYTEVRFYNDAELNESIIAWLGENDYEMFEERADGLNAYIPSKNFSEENLASALSHISSNENIRYETNFIKDQNWNKVWESNFEPVTIDDVHIRAPFHQPSSSAIDIVIEPKMSFGTGHHATTELMIRMMHGMELEGKRVLDFGSGTGILAIVADKLGAAECWAVDIEDWAFENCIENCSRNNSRNINVIKGDISKVKSHVFDVILANINRNVHLDLMNEYSILLSKNGVLLLSGILNEDKDIIHKKCLESELKFSGELLKDNWLALRYMKV